MTTRTCIAVDLKSFYASVECRERGLDPLTTHLVVADESRTDKTICLAVSPSLKAYGLPGRCGNGCGRSMRSAVCGRRAGGWWGSHPTRPSWPIIRNVRPD